MSKTVAQHETFHYKWNEPFQIKLAIARDEDYYFIRHSHWHTELEIAYIMHGHNLHFIDGECVQAEPGRLIVTNCESIHRIKTEYDNAEPDTCIGVVILIHRQFLKENFPEYDGLMFTNNKRQTSPEIKAIMSDCYDYALRTYHDPMEHLRIRGVLLQLLYYMCKEGTISRSSVEGQAIEKREQRSRDILDYIDDHYNEQLTQKDVAAKFFFSPDYFSRYFKKNTGMTFTEYITDYRLQQATMALLHTDKRISDIAIENGFSDDWNFIKAFKRAYNTTPLKFRKNQGLQASV